MPTFCLFPSAVFYLVNLPTSHVHIPVALSYFDPLNICFVSFLILRVPCNVLYPQEGWTPLLIASLAGNLILVDILLKAGANPDVALPVSIVFYNIAFE